jgi:hypothetical protein
MYLDYIDGFTIQVITFINWLVLAIALMYCGAALMSYFLREIFGLNKRKKNEKD